MVFLCVKTHPRSVAEKEKRKKKTDVLEIPSSPNVGLLDGLSGVTALNLLEPNTSLGKTPPGPLPADVSPTVNIP